MIAGFECEWSRQIAGAFPTAEYRICELDCTGEQKEAIRERLHKDYKNCRVVFEGRLSDLIVREEQAVVGMMILLFWQKLLKEHLGGYFFWCIWDLDCLEQRCTRSCCFRQPSMLRWICFRYREHRNHGGDVWKGISTGIFRTVSGSCNVRDKGSGVLPDAGYWSIVGFKNSL